MTQFLDLQALVQIVGPRFAEDAAARDADDAFAAANYDVLKEHKVFSALVPAELGGGGVRHSAMCAFLRRLAHYCPSTALALSMHQHLVAAAVYNHRNGRPGQKLLERVAADQTVLISTGANDWMESTGAAERADGGFLVSAKKPFGSGSPKGGRFHPAWNVILTVAMPLIMSVYTGVAEAAADIATAHAKKRHGDPIAPYLLGELTNALTTAQIAMDDMVRLANDLHFTMSLEVTSAILVRKTIVAEHVLATVEKALETAGGAGFYRKAGLERLLRDAHGAQFHPLSTKRQCRFTGRCALSLDPIADAA